MLCRRGDIVEQGVHSELIQRGGLYAEMWQRQAEAAATEEAEAPEGPPDVASDVTAPPTTPRRATCPTAMATERRLAASAPQSPGPSVWRSNEIGNCSR